ncbi:Na+/H+ antiporter NhaA [uncultured Veillonella sp.]|uniref:Na+/H+ antiporter NhaA n=1 Tax=uncultured Veillonella sp. TaxID=159268 RepID=UPI0025DF56AC|nr:Na+/H+ antiporter NhaA [uncultured Veillonella sp.]
MKRMKHIKHLKNFIEAQSSGGILLLLMAALAVWIANSPMASMYQSFLHMPLGPLSVELWVNDVLMAIFFLGVGLEVKHEMVDGALNTPSKRFLPSIAALMGVLAPAGIYYWFTSAQPELIRGWAIPTATDIAFSIGIISLLGSRVPVAAKVFLTTLAVVDDLIAILIIAVAYTESFNFLFMGGAIAVLVALVILNKRGVIAPWPYIILGVILWFCIFKSGLHATMAGVLLAMTIPTKGTPKKAVQDAKSLAQADGGEAQQVAKAGRTDEEADEVNPLMDWEHALSNWITFLIVPLFGFVNAGVSFGDFQLSDLQHPVLLGIALGLFVGKQVGIFGILLLLVKTKLVPMPKPMTWMHIYGVSLCCGVGFTMSLFVDLLAFPPGHAQELAKVGIFIGSIVSGVLGYLVLRYMAPDMSKKKAEVLS